MELCEQLQLGTFQQSEIPGQLILETIIPVTMETRCLHKKLEFQRYPPKDICTARYERKSSEKKTNFSWAKIGLRITQPNDCSKRRDSESWTDIDRQHQRLRHEF